MTVWKSVDQMNSYGVAKHNYDEPDKLHRLCLDVGDTVIVLRESAQWYYGYQKRCKTIFGIVPKSYVQIVECEFTKNEFIRKRSQIVKEIDTVLADWGEIFTQFFLSNHPNFHPIRRKIFELIRLRSLLLSGNLPVDEMKEMKLLATAEIDTGNSLLGLDMIVRDECGDILDINTTSTTSLYEHHTNAVDRIRKANNSNNPNRHSKQMNQHSHNLLVTVDAFICKHQEDSDLLLTLYDGDEMKAITENYVVKMGRQGLARDLDKFDNHRVLFTDLNNNDLKRNKVYLICYAVRVGSMDIKEVDPKRMSFANGGGVGGGSSLIRKHSSLSIGSTGSGNSAGGGNNNNGGGNDQMRRPFGVAAIDLTPVIKKPEDFKNNLYLPFILCEKDSLDNTLRKLISNKDFGKNDSKLAVRVELLHGDVKQIKDEFPHLVHGNVAFARKMGFPEVIFPGDVRNDLYLTLVGGEFSKGSKSSDKNIEVTAAVCNEKGVIVPGVLTLGAGAPMLNEYKSVIYYHEDRPKWNETFRIQVPIEEFKQCHLKFLFKHRSSNETKDKSEKPFGLSYVRLMQDNGTTLQHKCHQLIVYKIDYKKLPDKDGGQLNYLNLPSRTMELVKISKPSVPGLSVSSKDSFTIETNLCSTKLTQDVDLLGLLNWASHKETLEASLQALMNVSSEELVKFLQDILDALFNILVQNEDPKKFDHLVFKCLLKLIEIVSDLKYQHFQSVLDLYINESFSATLAYDKLINVLQSQIRNAVDVKLVTTIEHEFDICENLEKNLYQTIKNLQYIMKFIIRSRILFSNLNDDKDRLLFESTLEDLLSSFINLIASPHDLLRSQGALLKYFHIIASDLMQVYDPIRLCNYIVDIINKVPAGRLLQSKMICIKDMVNSKLFKLPECRAILLPVFCQQIKDKLESKEEGDLMSDIWHQEKNLSKAAKVLGVKNSSLHTRETTAKTKVAECVNIMNHMLELLFSNNVGPIENDIKDIMLILLRTVIQTSIAMDRDNPLVGNLVAIMLGIFRSMQSVHYNVYVTHFATRFDLQDFLTEILLVFKDLVSKPVFNADWMDMIMHQNTVILESLRQFSKVIMDCFFNPFEKQVWSNFFHCSIAFLIQPPLQLDQFSSNKKSTILTRYKDIRRETAYEIRSMWFNLGEHKISFVPQLVGSILEMSLLPELELRKATIPIFFDMMQCEYYASKYISESYGDTKRNNSHYKGNFFDFEKEMIEKLDILVESGRGDHEYKNLFYEIMIKLCRDHNTLRTEGEIFVIMVTNLLDRLLEYRCIMINDESKENRMACTVSLLQFYSEVNRKEMYIRYVHKLCDLHMEFDNFTEAAFTLTLHSNLLMWNDTKLSSLLRSYRHPHSQTHRQLKEALYAEIIEYFDKGKMWECAIDMCKELAHQYENEIYDYKSLSCIHVKLAQFYEKILKEMRHESEYFRVAFYGLKFPEFLRNKVFIYRGKEYERLSDFCVRILTQHPTAELMQTLQTPGDEITQTDGQYIQVNSVEPIMDAHSCKIKEKATAPEIIKYYQTNNVQSFKFSRPYRDNKDSGENTVGNLWLERTIMKTKFPLPGILRWFPVEYAETFKISPIQYAIETMELTNKVIRDLIIAHKNDETLPLHPLSMKIKGVVDPAVMGGFIKYEEAFFTVEYIEQNPEDQHLIDRLKDLIATQIPLLEVALHVHRIKTTTDVIPFHDQLEKCFAEMQSSVELKYGKRQSDIKFDRDLFVTMRRQSIMPQLSMDSNRLSETSMGSSDSGLSKSTNGNRTTAGSMKFNFNFNTPNLTRTSLGTLPNTKTKSKDKTPNKRRASRKIDRDAFSLSSSQWYTNSITLTPITSTPTSDQSDNASILSNCQSAPINVTTPVFELTEELTPKRPLRSEVEREKRLSRPTSVLTPTSSVKGMIINAGDTQSLSGESSNRNSIVTTDSTASEDDNIPPPLPLKTRESNDYSNLPTTTTTTSPTNDSNSNTLTRTTSHHSGKYTNKPLPAIPTTTTTPPTTIICSSDGVANSAYDIVETINPCYEDKRRPPTPPPKPTRTSKGGVV